MSLTSSDLSRDPVYRGLVRAALQGDAAALAACSDYRQDKGLPALANRPGGLAKKEKKTPSSWMPPMSVEQERECKKAAREMELAVAVGKAYHRMLYPLYVSKYGTVLYGRGGQKTYDRERYSKAWHRNHGATSNLNGGARIEGQGRKARIVLENHRGTEVARVPRPPKGVDLNAWILTVA